MKKNPIKALILVFACMLLVFSKNDVSASGNITQNDIVGTWTGAYQGTWNGEYFSRKITLNIQSYNSGTDAFSGIATIDDNKNGNYYFEGKVNPANNTISFEGKKWRYNPGDLGFSLFSGTFDRSAKTMSGTVRNSQITFSVRHTSTRFYETKVAAANVPAYWSGEDDGAYDGKPVRRGMKLHITSIKNGKVEGISRMLPSSKTDPYYGATGSYYVKGTYDEALGMIEIRGYKWIEYPVSENGFSGEWSFTTFKGYIDSASNKIIGSSEHGIWDMSICTAAEYNATPNYRENGTFKDKNGTYTTYAAGTADFKTSAKGLSTVTIPEYIEMYHQKYEVVSISDKAFYKNTNLREVDFSNAKVKKIGKKAFYGCKNLKTIRVNGDTLKKMSSKSFKGVKKAKVYIYAKDKKTYKKAVKAFKKSGIKKAKYKYVKH